MRVVAVAKRCAVAALVLGVPVLACKRDVVEWHVRRTVEVTYAWVRWGEGIGAVFGPSSRYLLVSLLCTALASLALALIAFRVLSGRAGAEAYRVPTNLLRALYVMHGTIAPFEALFATQHVSPTGRGRTVLATFLAAVLEHQVFLAFAAASASAAMMLGVRAARTSLVGDKSTPTPAIERLPLVAVLCLVSGLATRVLASTFSAAAAGARVASELETETLLAFVVAFAAFGVTAILLSRSAVQRPTSAPLASDDDGSSPRGGLAIGELVRAGAVLSLPLVSLVIVGKAASVPCDPSSAELDGVATALHASTQPLPLARGEDDGKAGEGVWLLSATKRLREAWPRGGATRELRFIVRNDEEDRGRTGFFARFGTGRFGVLHMTLRERDAPAITGCAPGATYPRCVTASHTDDGIAAVKSSSDPPSVVYLARPDDTVADLVHDVSRLVAAVHETSKTTPTEMDVDVVAALVPAEPTKPHPKSAGAPASPPSLPPVAKSVPGCATAHAAADFEAHDVMVAGQSRHFFVSAPASAAASGAPAAMEPRSLVIVLHGNGGSSEDIRSALSLEHAAGDHAAVLYLEARGHLWDVEKSADENADVAFVDAVVTWADEHLCTDVRHRFVTGFSGGGYLANLLACSGRFRALVAHAAGGPAPLDDEPDPPTGLFRCKAVPALVLHGADDTNVLPAEGLASAERWRVTNHCAPSPAAKGDCVRYGDCENAVIACVFPGLGHRLVSDAGQRTWDFFVRSSDSSRFVNEGSKTPSTRTE